jgi:hypothetical protein
LRNRQNRNLHLEFKRLDLLLNFNLIADGMNLKPTSSLSESKEVARIAGFFLQAKTRQNLAENRQIGQSDEAKDNF